MPVVRDIHTNQDDLSCDVCGRTLLRGERAEPFLAGGTRRHVCDLCTMRAEHEGWIREEGADEFALRGLRHERGRRGLFERLRGRRAPSPERDWNGDPGREPERSGGGPPDAGPAPAPAAEASAAHEPLQHAEEDRADVPAEPNGGAEAEHEPSADEPAARPAPRPALRRRLPSPPRRPRHVRAVPTNAELKMTRALEVFNVSEHVRTVGGVARSLGAPGVCVRPLADRPSVVVITVVWELSWYRYEVDLSDEALGVRQIAKGDELHELPAEEQQVNAGADERGALHLVAAAAS